MRVFYCRSYAAFSFLKILTISLLVAQVSFEMVSPQKTPEKKKLSDIRSHVVIKSLSYDATHLLFTFYKQMH